MILEVPAEIPGIVIDVMVKPGDEVHIGDSVALLDSMKMEIPIISDDAGVVSCVNVRCGERIAAHACAVTLVV